MRSPPRNLERRADRRHPLKGFARIVPQAGVGPTDPPTYAGPPEWYGAVVDVSARGLRLRLRPGNDLPDDLRFEVVLEVSVPGGGPDTPAVRLHGAASLVRRSMSAGDPMEEIAFRFDEALRVGDAFGAPARAAVRPEGLLA